MSLNKKNIAYICVTFLFVFLLSVKAKQNPLAFDFHGIRVAPDDLGRLLAATADEIEKNAQRSRKNKEQAIQSFEQQLIDLGKKHDCGAIGQNEFDTAKSVLVGKIERLKKEIDDQDKAAANVGNNVQQVIMSGWQTLLENYKVEQQAKQQKEIAAINKGIENEGLKERAKLEIEASMQKLKYMSDPTNLKYYALFLAGASAGVAGGYFGLKLAYNYCNKKLENRPTLALETSYVGWADSMKSSFWKFFGYTSPQLTLEDNIVFHPTLEEELTTIARTTRMIKDKGLNYPAMLLYGPPGTGKTWYAKLLAYTSGMYFIYTSADRFAQFSPGQDVQEIHALFDFAEQCQGGVVLIIDEIDSLATNRNNLDQASIQRLNAFLVRTSKSSTNVKIVGITNRKHVLDEAFLSRFPQQICVPLPGPEERERLINLYLKKYIIEDKRTIKKDGKQLETQLAISPEITQVMIKDVAHRAEVSGRTIEQMVDEMRTCCYMSEELMLTPKIFEDVSKKFILHAVA